MPPAPCDTSVTDSSTFQITSGAALAAHIENEVALASSFPSVSKNKCQQRFYIRCFSFQPEVCSLWNGQVAQVVQSYGNGCVMEGYACNAVRNTYSASLPTTILHSLLFLPALSLFFMEWPSGASCTVVRMAMHVSWTVSFINASLTFPDLYREPNEQMNR